MDNHHLYQPDWEKVLAVLDQELPETTALTASESSLLAELKQIKQASKYYNESEFGAEARVSEIKQRLFFTDDQQPKTSRLWPKIIVAAAIATMIASAGIWFLKSEKNASPGHNEVAYKNDVAPGKQGATLTLASGKKIRLSDAANGELAKEAGVVITKSANGQLVYEIKESGTELTNKINTLSTAKGETYEVRLPDGSLVSLNAASSLEYPANFTALKERRVKLTGEGYFEVAKDKAHPFIVESATQQVEVLGTHFNVNTYTDEPSAKTTLLEGSVSLNRNTILKPGEQATMNKAGKVKVVQADIDQAIAWKNGKFVFEREEIESVMRMLSRWYNVEVVYQGDVKDMTFTGSISRFDNISKILDKIRFTETIHFKIEGRRIYVMP